MSDAFAARLRADTVGTDAALPLPGGLVRLRCDRFPNSYDLNAVWAPVGADQATVDAAVLREARLAGWREVDPDHAEELADRQVALDELDEVTTLAVLDDGSPVAWCTVVATAIDDVWTVPSHRRRGLARSIVRAAVAAGGEQLTVDPDNDGAVALYRSEGFVDAGRLVGLLRSSG